MTDPTQDVKAKRAADSANREAKNRRHDAILIQLADLLFVAVPIIIFSLVFWQKNTFHNFWTMPEWSFAATVLLGQTVAKFASGAIANPHGIRPPRMGVYVTGLVVLLILSAAVLLLVLSETITPLGQNPLSTGLTVAQFVVLLLAMSASCSWAVRPSLTE